MSSIKKVTFSEDSKSHDGTIISEVDIRFYKLICGFFNTEFQRKKYTVTTKFDILRLVDYNSDIIIYCKNRIDELLQLLLEKNIPKEECIYTKDDPYWDNDMFINSSKKKKSGSKVALVRNGCRDFNISLDTIHIPYIKNLLVLLMEAEKENEYDISDWIILDADGIVV